MKQITVTALFFVFMYLFTAAYTAKAQQGYENYYNQQQQIQDLQRQQQEMQRQQQQLELQRTIQSINRGCVRAANGQEFC